MVFKRPKPFLIKRILLLLLNFVFFHISKAKIKSSDLAFIKNIIMGTQTFKKNTYQSMLYLYVLFPNFPFNTIKSN